MAGFEPADSTLNEWIQLNHFCTSIDIAVCTFTLQKKSVNSDRVNTHKIPLVIRARLDPSRKNTLCYTLFLLQVSFLGLRIRRPAHNIRALFFYIIFIHI